MSDDAIIAALVNGASQRQAAARAGVSEGTVRFRLKDAQFVAHLDSERDKAAETPSGLPAIYAGLERLRRTHAQVSRLDSTDLELTAAETKRNLAEAIRWLEEWAWLLETQGD